MTDGPRIPTIDRPATPAQEGVTPSVRVEAAMDAPHAWFLDAEGVERSLKQRELFALGAVWGVAAAVTVAVAVFTVWWLAVLLVAAQAAGAAYALSSSFTAGRDILALDGIHPVDVRTQPALHRLAVDTANRLGCELPPMYLLENKSPNAFVTLVGSRRPIMVIHTGWLAVATAEETRGVLAHELAHVRNKDLWVGALLRSATFLPDAAARSTATARPSRRKSPADSFVTSFVSLFGLLSKLMALAVSRTHETRADLTAARALGGAGPVVACLRRLEGVAAHSAGRTAVVPHRFRTHPATTARIDFLRDHCSRQASYLPAPGATTPR